MARCGHGRDMLDREISEAEYNFRVHMRNDNIDLGMFELTTHRFWEVLQIKEEKRMFSEFMTEEIRAFYLRSFAYEARRRGGRIPSGIYDHVMTDLEFCKILIAGNAFLDHKFDSQQNDI